MSREPSGSSADEDPNGYLRRAAALWDFGRAEEAAAELRRGVAAFPDSAALWSELGWTEYRCSHSEEGRSAAERALALHPDDVRAHLTLAALELRDEQPRLARPHIDRALALAPEVPAAHLFAAWALRAEPRGDVSHREPIRAHVHRAVALAPHDAGVYAAAAQMLGGIADKGELSHLVAQGLAIDPEHEDLLLLASDVHTRTDAQAMRVLSGVLAQNPQQREAAFAMTSAVWERTRLVAALAAWLLVAIAVPPAVFAVIGAICVNLFQLLVGTTRSAPRGFLRQTWSRPPWARAGVVLVLVGAAWPVLMGALLGTGALGLLPVPLLAALFVALLGAGDATGRFWPLLGVIALVLAAPPAFSLLLRQRQLGAAVSGEAAGARAPMRFAIAAAAASVALAVVMACAPPVPSERIPDPEPSPTRPEQPIIPTAPAPTPTPIELPELQWDLPEIPDLDGQ
ncbi:tetratricopeptide repeat protein [Leucobacter chironomi]|uniref:tetratricopeptide repeat protein n=1 Tax=Leucobacter chironomi TaxID=491918 RepID=UPI00041FEEF4|nr:tetratricopeptide repeat protein [Leucobacter chironomi]